MSQGFSGKTKRLTGIAMLCAAAYIVMAVGRFPVVLFLKYDPKDVIIVIGGLIWGPSAACAVSVIVSAVEMVTVSETGILGCLMNIISSCSFACTASFIFRKRNTISSLLIGLAAGGIMMTAVMLLWNYLLAPFYMGCSREAVVRLLVPAFLPFNLLKASLNAGITIFCYKPVISSLRKNGYILTPDRGKTAPHEE